MTSLRVFEKTRLYVNFKSVNSSQLHVLLKNQLSTLNANRNTENEICSNILNQTLNEGHWYVRTIDVRSVNRLT